MAITITNVKLCGTGGGHMIFTAVDENGKDVSFAKHVVEVLPPAEDKPDEEKLMDDVRAKIATADAKTFEEAKLAILAGSK